VTARKGSRQEIAGQEGGAGEGDRPGEEGVSREPCVSRGPWVDDEGSGKEGLGEKVPAVKKAIKTTATRAAASTRPTSKRAVKKTAR
jgi:hypothetical protein